GLTAAAASVAGPVAAGEPGEPGERDAAGPDSGPDKGRIRLEFNTPAKPALITWTADSGRDGVPAFRYLLVPLRVPERS
ncbi:MAG TPA: hypothetical protein VN961_24645, partial [Streptosporangiaceae bacterium]|nr:hypothetical protein [Streptosporangiaceae bacterium]